MVLVIATTTRASQVFIPEPAGDRWMYWFGDSSGSRSSASVYGAYGSHDYPNYDFDDRHGQMFLDFDTSSVVTPAKGVGNYNIKSLVVSIIVNYGNIFPYDPSFDTLQTYQNESLDADAGRPIELFGVGYRGGFNLATFRENSAYQSVSGNKATRNAYAMGFLNGEAVDVSNNVEQGFEVSPWAVGQINGELDLDGNFRELSLPLGALVPVDAVMNFAIDIGNPAIRTYVQSGLNAGRLQFMVTSLYPAQQQVSNVPSFHTKESYYHQSVEFPDLYLAAQLSAEISIAATSHKPELKIVASSGPSYRISFSSKNGFNYRLEYKNSLSVTSWTGLGESITGNGEELFFEDTTAAGQLSRFYRVISNPN
jgi:hypothetical protein